MARNRKPRKGPASYLREPLVDLLGAEISSWTYPSMPWQSGSIDWRQLCRLRARQLLTLCDQRAGAVDSLMENPETGHKLEEIGVVYRVVVGRLLAPGRDYRDISGRMEPDAYLAVKWPTETLRRIYVERWRPWAQSQSALITLRGTSYLALTLDYIDGERPRLDEVDALVAAINAY